MEEIVLVGYGGHAKSVADCIEKQGEFHIAGYTDVVQRDSPYEYFGKDDVLKELFNQGIRNAAIVVGYLGKGNTRERLYGLLKRIGFALPVIIDPSAIISSTAIIGEGSFIGKNVVINSNAIVGDLAIINTSAVVEHDCKVGDFAHVSVGAVLCGMVTIGKRSFVGANTTIIQTVQVGSDVIISAGIVVMHDVKEGSIVKLNTTQTINVTEGGGGIKKRIYDGYVGGVVA